MRLDYLIRIPPNHDQVIRPYIIAEAGVSHEGSMDLAKRLIDEAKEGGAQAIKFQTYKAETIASKDSPVYWDITKESTQSQWAGYFCMRSPIMAKFAFLSSVG